MDIGSRVFAFTYDKMIAGVEKAGLREHRRELLAGAAGSVLEIGAGTGLNLVHYGDAIGRLAVTEPDPAMARRLEQRVLQNGRPVEVVRAHAEDLPFGDDEFDVAVSTLVLCTVEDQARALRELRRVLRPGGRLLFVEHVRADEPKLARWQDRLNGFNRVMGHGCNCNRSTLDGIRAAGFAITSLERDTLKKAPPIVRPLVIGVAEANGAGA